MCINCFINLIITIKQNSIMEEVKIVFKGRSYTFHISEVMFFEILKDNLYFALNKHDLIMDLEKYEFQGMYKIPTSDFILATVR